MRFSTLFDICFFYYEICCLFLMNCSRAFSILFAYGTYNLAGDFGSSYGLLTIGFSDFEFT